VDLRISLLLKATLINCKINELFLFTFFVLCERVSCFLQHEKNLVSFQSIITQNFKKRLNVIYTGSNFCVCVLTDNFICFLKQKLTSCSTQLMKNNWENYCSAKNRISAWFAIRKSANPELW